MKWVMNYDMNFIEHLAFVVNGEKTWAHCGEVYSLIKGCVLVT
jgi:hypothetical protein